MSKASSPPRGTVAYTATVPLFLRRAKFFIHIVKSIILTPRTCIFRGKHVFIYEIALTSVKKYIIIVEIEFN